MASRLGTFVLGPAYAGILSHLINLSLRTWSVPEQWKTAIIYPLSKVTPSEAPANLRPISVIPILSRVTEREIVRGGFWAAFDFQSPPPLECVQRVSWMVVLGVTVEDDLRFTEHSSNTLDACSRSVNAIWELLAHGLPQGALHLVARATTVVKLLYMPPRLVGLLLGWQAPTKGKVYL